MKRVVRDRSHSNHLSDIISKITNILICDDAALIPCAVHAAEDIEDDGEGFYLGLTDEQLLQLTEERVRQFTDLELLDRVYHLAPYRLSAQQIDSLREWYRTKRIIDKSDVQKIINLLRNCNTISYYGRHRKTNQFARDVNDVLREKDCLDIIHQLTVQDYVANSRSINLSHFGNNIIIFQPDADWETDDGIVIEDLTIYIKIDVDESTQTAVALVSFHAAEFRNNHPYSDR